MTQTIHKKAFMTSPIGDLTIDSDGLRTAINEIARLQKALAAAIGSNEQEIREKAHKEGYTKGIDDFKEIIINSYFKNTLGNYLDSPAELELNDIKVIADQLKTSLIKESER